MKTLYPAQQKALDFFLQTHRTGRNSLDTSVVGTGKTVVSVHLTQQLDRPVAVVCPKAVITNWKREFQAHGVEPIFVLNYEKLRNGSTQYLSKTGKKIMRWNLPSDTLLIFDECHKCQGAFSMNAQLLIAAKQQDLALHLLSATACEDPTEMRALGFAIGLHSLNSPKGLLRSWTSWLYTVGCKQDIWNSWYVSDKAKLSELHKVLYGPQGCAFRLTVADFPDSFRKNNVQILPVSCTKKVTQAYSNEGLTEDSITRFLLEEEVIEQDDSEELFIVRLLRARQAAELGKVQDLIALTNDYVEQGLSVVLFMNFRETIEQLREALDCPVIQGGQKAEDRQQIIDDFQADRGCGILIANIEAGGTGLSLHDVKGQRPRVSLISPTFNVKSHMQVLGRIFRNGAQSDSLQQVVVADDTVETSVMDVIASKIKNLESLHGK
jgi:superfamily II DNA or RNA helicase